MRHLPKSAYMWLTVYSLALEMGILYDTNHKLLNGFNMRFVLRKYLCSEHPKFLLFLLFLGRKKNMYAYQCLKPRSKIEKVTGGFRGEKSSKDMASSRNLVSTIGEQASPTMGDGTRCPEG